MDVRKEYPDFAGIERQIHAARVERSLAVSQLILAGLAAIARGTRRLAASFGENLAAERDRRAIEADSFLKRSVPRY